MKRSKQTGNGICMDLWDHIIKFVRWKHPAMGTWRRLMCMEPLIVSHPTKQCARDHSSRRS